VNFLAILVGNDGAVRCSCICPQHNPVLHDTSELSKTNARYPYCL
jgi:hypothetical protein